MTVIYNEVEPYAVAWLRNLSEAGHIARGSVDARSVAALEPADVAGAVQFHTFAGIGAWSYALRLAGWPDDRPVWTGSCPCQPFSNAGQRRGFADERHLWPTWFRLIRECGPPVVFGEQVASKDGIAWFDIVRADLESAGYAVGAAVLPAAGVGAPHVRHRLFFGAVRVAYAGYRDESDRLGVGGAASSRGGEVREQRIWVDAGAGGHVDGLADAAVQGPQRGAFAGERPDAQLATAERGRAPVNPWSPVEWLPCRDGARRPTQPGLLPLAHGAPARVGRLRAYGNAIVPQAAAAFVSSFMEAM